MSSGIQRRLNELKISVTELVQFAAREGDLFHEDLLGPDAQEGLRGHQAIQKARSTEWQAEYSLSHCFMLDQGRLQLGGRVDLINLNCSPPVLEEIKTCYGPGHLFPIERKALHWAQLKVYAGLFCLENPQVQKLLLRVSYFDLQTQQISMEEECLNVTAVRKFTEECVNAYWQWWRLVQKHKNQESEFCQNLNFPFKAFREGQRTLAEQVYRSLRAARHLVFEAPTGTGKTLSALFPALKALGEQHIEQLLYLTPKGSAQLNVLAALESLEQADASEVGVGRSDTNTQLNVLVLQARDKACPCLSAEQAVSARCLSERGLCTRTLGFYDRLPAAREEALKSRKLTVANLQTLAERYQLCPFAFSIQLLPWFSIVVADVNYFFDPLVRLSAFEQQGKRCALLIDEAHNLSARARDMYSAVLDSEELAQVIQALPKTLGYLKTPMKKLLSCLRALDADHIAKQTLPEKLGWALHELMQAMQQSADNGFAGGLLGAGPQAYRAWVKQLYRWAAISRLRGEAHCYLLPQLGSGKDSPVTAGKQASSNYQNTKQKYSEKQVMHQERRLAIRCLDAASFLGALMEKTRSSILFSATLQPFEYSVRQFGLDNATACLEMPSRFPVENQLSLICRFVETDWHRRDASLENLVKLIATVIERKPGNYLVFFPSFSYLEMTLTVFKACFPGQVVEVQKPAASDEERQQFISKFKNQREPVLGFAVVGGVFSEGVDYVGESLIGAIVIGTGMPQPSEEQQRIAQYYKQQGLNAFRYAYLYPGFVRLLQTAGRVIRSEKDRGVVVFVEPRLTRVEYRKLFPAHWRLQQSGSFQELESQIRKFWQPG